MIENSFKYHINRWRSFRQKKSRRFPFGIKNKTTARQIITMPQIIKFRGLNSIASITSSMLCDLQPHEATPNSILWTPAVFDKSVLFAKEGYAVEPINPTAEVAINFLLVVFIKFRSCIYILLLMCYSQEFI